MAGPFHPWRRVRGAMLAAVLAAAALPLLYGFAALVGTLIPANAAWSAPAHGVTIYVRTNGLHTDIVVPYATPDFDWRGIVGPGLLRRPPDAGDYLAFGWGDRDFYLNTPTWSDLTVGTTLHTLFGHGGTLLHVHHVRDPSVTVNQRRLVLTDAQFARLNLHIRESFNLSPDGHARAIRGYSGAGMFYAALGDWSLVRTSNEWTGAGLRQAGVRIGCWTPFAPSVMWWLD